jgi:spore germination protein GerM
MTRVALLGALVAAVALGACGVPAQDEPHRVELPRNPLTTVTARPAPTESHGGVAVVVCLTRSGRLAQTVRRLGSFPSVQQQLDNLTAGPTRAEQDNGLGTALAGFTLRARQAPSSTEVTVDITEADESNARSDEVLAYGQIVWTLTARADIDSVVFTRDNRRLEVPRADGTLSRGPLHAGDYASLVSPA